MILALVNPIPPPTLKIHRHLQAFEALHVPAVYRTVLNMADLVSYKPPEIVIADIYLFCPSMQYLVLGMAQTGEVVLADE